MIGSTSWSCSSSKAGIVSDRPAGGHARRRGASDIAVGPHLDDGPGPARDDVARRRDWTTLAGPHGYLPRQVTAGPRQWEITKTRDLPAMDRLRAQLADQLAALPDDLPWSLVHGDFRLDNCILAAHSPEVIAVLDWEMSTLGDPLSDLALILLYWTRPTDVLRHRIPVSQGVTERPGFWDRSRIVEAYQADSGRTVDHLDACAALACFKLAVITESIHARTLGGQQLGTAAKDLTGMGVATESLADLGLAVTREGTVAGLSSDIRSPPGSLMQPDRDVAGIGLRRAHHRPRQPEHPSGGQRPRDPPSRQHRAGLLDDNPGQCTVLEPPQQQSPARGRGRPAAPGPARPRRTAPRPGGAPRPGARDPRPASSAPGPPRADRPGRRRRPCRRGGGGCRRRTPPAHWCAERCRRAAPGARRPARARGGGTARCRAPSRR